MSDITEASAMDALKSKPHSYESIPLTPEIKMNVFQTPPKVVSVKDDKPWTNDRIRNITSNILTVISLIFLIPGLWYPMINIRITALLHLITIIDDTRSIVSTISFLFQSQSYLAGILILLFSVVVPIAKAILLLLMNVSKSARYNYTVYTIVRDWGKWSMADVFVTAVFISYLSSTVIVDVKATLLPGFYCFLAYCILALLAVQVMVPPPMFEVENDYEKTGVDNHIRDDNK